MLAVSEWLYIGQALRIVLTVRTHRSLAHRPARSQELRAGVVIRLGPIAQHESELDNSQTAESERWPSFPTCATTRHVGYQQIYSSSMT